jgi:hypothetical protein
MRRNVCSRQRHRPRALSWSCSCARRASRQPANLLVLQTAYNRDAETRASRILMDEIIEHVAPLANQMPVDASTRFGLFAPRRAMQNHPRERVCEAGRRSASALTSARTALRYVDSVSQPLELHLGNQRNRLAQFFRASSSSGLR